MEARGGEGPDVFIQDADGACPLSSEQGVQGGDEAEVPLAPVEERQGKAQQRLGQRVPASRILRVCW